MIYFNRTADGRLEVLDGQQRITSFGRFVTGKFAIKDENDNVQYFSGLSEELQKRIMESPLLIYECEGEEKEIKEWFKTINIAGVPLNEIRGYSCEYDTDDGVKVYEIEFKHKGYEYSYELFKNVCNSIFYNSSYSAEITAESRGNSKKRQRKCQYFE